MDRPRLLRARLTGKPRLEKRRNAASGPLRAATEGVRSVVAAPPWQRRHNCFPLGSSAFTPQTAVRFVTTHVIR